MRKKAKFIVNDPESGTTRVRRVFVWTPKQVEDEVIWLAYYEQLEAFIVMEYLVKIDGIPKKVSAGSWVSIEKRLMK